MESLITEPGPKNPLLFLSLSLVNRIPGYNPDEKETLNQLECLNDLISSVSASIFRLESVKNPVAVAVDSLMSIAVVEAKKSILVRVSALECLKLLIEKLVACGINIIIEIIPGILSKMVKISTCRVDVEVDRIIQLSLDIIELVIKCYLKEEEDWFNTKAVADEEFVLLKQKYRNNIDMIVCSLRPIIKNRQRSETFHETLFNILNQNLSNNFCSYSSMKLYLIHTAYDKSNVSLLHNKKLVDIYNNEIVEWFYENSEKLREIHEETLIEKIEIIFGLINLKNSSSFLIISDLFTILKQLTEVKVSIGDTVSIEYSDEIISFGIKNSFSQFKPEQIKIPKINFKSKLKISKEFQFLIEKLFKKMIEIDSKALERLLLEFEDDTTEKLIQKLDLTSLYYSKLKFLTVNLSSSGTLDLLKDCLKYYERSVKSCEEVEKSQMIHLATLKLLLSISETFPQLLRSNLLIILAAMTSDWIILKETSTQILKVIAKGNCNEFIKEHEIFLLDRLGIQLSLPLFYPESPQIISCLVRDILEPETAMKFTDLLVKKVSDNLAIYQGYPAYCKDLLTVATETIEVISKGAAIEFIDPKDYAFTKDNRDHDDDKANSENCSVLNCQQRIILDLLKIGINFILSDSKLIRSKSINLITCSVNNFMKYTQTNQESSDLCQLIHLAWPNMISVLKDSISKNPTMVQLDVLVVESFASCASILFQKFPLFMRDRFVKDFWRLTLKTMKTKKDHANTNSCHLQVIKLLFDTLNCGILSCKPSTEICLEILNYLHQDVKELPVDVLKSISMIEPDIIWYFYSIELGGIDEIKSPYPDLKSFKIAKFNNSYCNNHNDNLLKSKLKQFITQ